MRRSASYPELSPAARASSWDSARLTAFLAKSALFRGAAESARALARAARPVRLSAGQALCAAGDPAKEIWVLLEGRIKVCRPLPDGSAPSLEIMLPGDAFGLPALACWRYPSAIEAAEDSLVASFSRDLVLRELDRSPALSRSAFSLLGARLAFLESQLALARRPVSVRLAAALVYLEHKFGRSVPLTRAEIGGLAGTTPETAMRVLQGFAREGLVLLRVGGLDVLDVGRLRALAQG